MAVDLIEALLWRFPMKWEQVALLLGPLFISYNILLCYIRGGQWKWIDERGKMSFNIWI